MTLQRYLIGLVSLCIAPLLALGALLAIDHVLDVRNHVQSEAHALVRRAAQLIDQDLHDQLKAVQLLAGSPLADDAQRQAEFYRDAQHYVRVFGNHVQKVDAQSRAMLFSTRLPFGAPLPPPPHVEGRSAIDAAAASGRPEVGDRFVGPIDQVPLVAVAVPVLRDTRSPFFLLATIETRRFEQRIAEAGLPAGWMLTLRDSRGATLATQGRHDAVPGEGAPLQAGLALSNAPWRVELEVPRTIYMKPVQSTAAAVSAGLALLTLTAVIGGSLAARRLSHAIRKLMVSARGELHDAPRSAIDEIATVQELQHDATQRREQAGAERRADEQRHRESMAQAALQLQISEARLRGIVDSASEGIVTVDAAQTILMVNRAAARIFGHAPEALLGRPLDMLLPERLRDRHRANVKAFGDAESAARPMGERPPVTGLHASGREIPIEAAISQVHVDGQRLFTVILRDISERLRAEELIRTAKAELEASHAALQRLVAAQDSVQEQERKRIARELHDDLQQTLAAIKMDTLAIGQQLQRDSSRVPAMLGKIDELATAAIASTRRIVNDLRPQMLEELGLRPALEALAADYSQRTGIDCQLGLDDCCGEDAPIAPAVATCLYRVAQEALNNVHKHAGARRVRITLAQPQRGRVRLRIADDGRGFGPGDRDKRHSFGLVGMGERVRAIGGRLQLGRAPVGGVVVEVDAPALAEAPAVSR